MAQQRQIGQQQQHCRTNLGRQQRVTLVGSQRRSASLSQQFQCFFIALPPTYSRLQAANLPMHGPHHSFCASFLVTARSFVAVTCQRIRRAAQAREPRSAARRAQTCLCGPLGMRGGAVGAPQRLCRSAREILSRWQATSGRPLPRGPRGCGKVFALPTRCRSRTRRARVSARSEVGQAVVMRAATGVRALVALCVSIRARLSPASVARALPDVAGRSGQACIRPLAAAHPRLAARQSATGTGSGSREAAASGRPQGHLAPCGTAAAPPPPGPSRSVPLPLLLQLAACALPSQAALPNPPWKSGNFAPLLEDRCGGCGLVVAP